MQNTSHAVMSQRVEAHDSLDHFPTPPWATRALCEWIALPAFHRWDAWEPACAEGYMSRVLAEYFDPVYSSDIHPYGFGEVQDFFFPIHRRADFIITNPPFRLAERFALAAIDRADKGVALLVRTAFLESATRYESLFSRAAPTDILQFVERVPMHKGRLDRYGSTATAYCWLFWRIRQIGIGGRTEFHWLAPCRKRLERDSDYAPISSVASQSTCVNETESEQVTE